MSEGPDAYRHAAMERLNDATALFSRGQFGGSIYFSGLAVECTLRAYLVRRNPTFHSRHDLRELLKASGLVGLFPEAQRQRLTIALSVVWARWKNAYRFLPSSYIRADLRKRRVLAGIKGDPMKQAARQLLDSSQEIVGMGHYRWNKS